jgi:hypothetical protein
MTIRERIIRPRIRITTTSNTSTVLVLASNNEFVYLFESQYEKQVLVGSRSKR